MLANPFNENQVLKLALKIMAYTAFDKARGAPLLVGRLRSISPPTVAQSNIQTKTDQFWIPLSGGIVFLSAAFFVWRRLSIRRRIKPPMDDSEDQIQLGDRPLPSEAGDGMSAEFDFAKLDPTAAGRIPLTKFK